MARPSWHISDPGLVEAIVNDLREYQPNLHLHIERNGDTEICGTFSVRSPENQELDRFNLKIVIGRNYPKDAPTVFEVGGRIPRTPERHMNPNGSACLYIAEEREQVFPEGAEFSRFLNGPLNDFFLGQLYFEEHKEWPFGEWSHGSLGTYEYYCELTETKSLPEVLRYVRILSYPRLKGHTDCPCGSGEKVRHCCTDALQSMRSKVKPVLAKQALRTLLELQNKVIRYAQEKSI